MGLMFGYVNKVVYKYRIKSVEEPLTLERV
jgi:hypothetical protein